jgi:hypothetical protein
MTALFRIATFVNNSELYEVMRRSFEAAGFVDPIAIYTVEEGEPYSAITRLGSAPERYVILVHQDVRSDHGDTAADLATRLEDLTARDPSWAIAGNAGMTAKRSAVIHISDPHGVVWHRPLPKKVATLDENFLILRTARRPRCSRTLSGFHLYGTDGCLNAAADGSSAYVIDFRLTHLSGGNETGYDESVRRFVLHWSRQFHARYVRTTYGLLFFSRWRILRATLGHPHIVWRLQKRYAERDRQLNRHDEAARP